MKYPYRLYENGFGYIQLTGVDPGKLPEEISLEGDILLRKEEFHISLVWVNRLAEIVDRDNKQKIREEILKEFDEFIKENSLADYELTDELRLVKAGGQKTVIVMARVPNLDIFFEKLSRKYGVGLPLQPAHVTLYTLPPDRIGIGIFSDEELQKNSKPVDIPQLQTLL